ncbi:short-chain dehydrogenase [Acidovorax sp. Root219]|nr:short-chain dehydrogenase [Acidovorax sp. Root219]
MAEHCARLWITKGSADMVLVGRNEAKLQRTIADLAVRSPTSTFTSLTIDFLDATSIDGTALAICEAGLPDIVLIAHGSLPDQTACQTNLHACRDELEINGVSPALFAEAFAARMVPADQGTIILISSVAGERGRQSNYVYGAAKGMLSLYAQGLQHRVASSCRNLNVLLVKPGPTATPMTAHLTEQGVALATVEDVARAIVDAADKGKAEIYAPGKWWLIMLVIRHLPRFVFNRLRI